MGTHDAPPLPDLSTRDLNRLGAIQHAVLNRMKAAYSATRRELETRFLERYEEEGSKSFVVRFDELGKVATATLNEPRDKPYVADEAAFVAWVEANHPGEVVRTVRESYQKVLFERNVKLTDDGLVIHAKTGEAIPGLSVRKGGDPTSFTLSFEKRGDDNAEDDVFDLALGQSVPALLGIEAGGEG